MRDTITVGTIAGLGGVLVMTGFQYLAKALGLLQLTNIQIAASSLVDQTQLTTVWGSLLGIFTHLMIGIVSGVIIAYVIRLSGTDYYWLKGIVVGAFLFLVGMALLPRVLPVVPGGKIDSVAALIHMFSHLIFGVIGAGIVAKFGELTKRA